MKPVYTYIETFSMFMPAQVKTKSYTRQALENESVRTECCVVKQVTDEPESCVLTPFKQIRLEV